MLRHGDVGHDSNHIMNLLAVKTVHKSSTQCSQNEDGQVVRVSMLTEFVKSKPDLYLWFLFQFLFLPCFAIKCNLVIRTMIWSTDKKRYV